MARVLVIDDDEQLVGITRELLEDAGFDVDVLREFTRARIDDALMRRPDVVLLDSASTTDYGSSWGLAARLRSRENAPQVVMFTAHHAPAREARDRTTQRSIRADFAAVIEKPFEIDRLVEVLRTALKRS